MNGHTSIALKAAAKALEEVIAPAVDGETPLATEQVQLVRGVLEFVEQRLDHEHALRRFELAHYLDLAREVGLAPDSALRDDPGASTAELRDAAAGVAAAISAHVRSSTDRHVLLAVVSASRPFLDAQRAWFAPQGFEVDPYVLPSIDAALEVA
jgi:hypothetical protein